VFIYIEVVDFQDTVLELSVSDRNTGGGLLRLMRPRFVFSTQASGYWGHIVVGLLRTDHQILTTGFHRSLLVQIEANICRNLSVRYICILDSNHKV
jgi:hypothetical protein